jgi:hypothetical protein
MGNFFLIHDTRDSDLATMGPKRANEVGATAIGVNGVDALKAELSRLKKAGALIDQLLFYTHGNAGAIQFGNNHLTAGRILSEFAGNGFEDLFMPGAHIFFDGCNVATTKSGCSVPESCAMTDNGPVFLMTVAKTFLFKGGGRAGGWTSSGIGFPFLGGTKIWHPLGHRVYVYVNKGGALRLAIGDEFSTLGFTVWKVWNGMEYFYYSFLNDGRVFWCTEDEYDKPFAAWQKVKDLTDADRRGKWRLDSGSLQIQWVSVGSETWDLPLFTQYQTGIAFGSGFPMPGRPGPDGTTGDVVAELKLGDFPSSVYLLAN